MATPEERLALNEITMEEYWEEIHEINKLVEEVHERLFAPELAIIRAKDIITKDFTQTGVENGIPVYELKKTA